jgi:Flp pilus assembly protein TadD
MSATVERFEALMNVRRYAEAETIARDLIAQYPDWGPAYTHLARALVELKRHDEALEAAKLGVQKDPRSAWAHGTLGHVYEGMERPNDAVHCAQEAMRLCPANRYAYCLLSYNYDRLWQFSKALEATTAGLKHHPHDQELLRFHAFNLYKLYRLSEAEAVARECLRLHPTSHDSMHVLGLTHLTRARWSIFRRVQFHRRAHEFFMQAVRLMPMVAQYQKDARANAISCRGFVWLSLFWFPYLTFWGLMTCFFLAWDAGCWSVGPPAQMIVAVLFQIFVAAFGLPFEDNTRFLETPLINWFDLPPIPPETSEKRPSVISWQILVFIPPLAAVIGAIVAVILRHPPSKPIRGPWGF